MNKTLRLLFIICLSVLHALTTMASEHSARLEEIQEYIRQGNYLKASERITKLFDKLEGKDARYERGLLLIYKAQVASGLCAYDDMAISLHDGLQQLRSSKGLESAEYCYGLLESAKLNIDYGNYLHASEDLEQARSLMPKFPQKDSALSYAIREQELLVAINQGYLNQADKALLPLLAYYKTLAEREAVASGEKSKKEVKKEIEQQKQVYARLLLLQAYVPIYKGEKDQATTLLTAAQQWIKKNIGTSSEAYVRCLVAQAKNEEEYGYYDQAIKFYKKAIGAANSKRNILASHKDYFAMHEDMIRSTLNAAKDKKANGMYESYVKLVHKQHPEDNGYQAKLARIGGYIAVSQEEFNDGQFLNLINVSEDTVTNVMAPSERLKILTLIYQIGIYMDTLPLAKEALNNILVLKKKMYGTQSPQYQESRIEKGFYALLYENKIKDAKNLFEDSWLKQVKPQLSRKHKDYPRFLNMHAKYYELTDQYALATQAYDEAKNLIVEKYGEGDLEYGHQLEKIASINIRVGQYKKAEEQLMEAINIVENARGKYSRDYISVLRTMARLYIVIGWYDEADKLLTRSFKLQKTATESPALGSENMTELATLLYEKGLYAECDEILTELIDVYEEQNGKVNQYLIEPLNILGSTYLARGDYSNAEKMAQRSANISSEIFGDTSSRYTQSIALMQKIHAAIGDYDRSEELAQKVLERDKKQLGKLHIEVARATKDLALAKFQNKGKPKETEKLLKESIAVTESILGDFHPQYADGLKNLAFFYIDQKRYAEADSLLTIANEIWRNKLGKNNAYTAEVYMLKGDLSKANADHKTANKMYGRSKEMYERLFGNRHPQYVQVLSRLAQMAYIEKNYSKTTKMLGETTKIYLEYISKYFPSLSDREKTKFWNLMKPDFELYSSLAVLLADKKPELLANVYNYNLATKALLLNSSIKIKDRILKSKDTKMIDKYHDWLGKKERLANLMSKSTEELASAGIDLKKIEQDIENLEKSLSEGSELFAQAKESANYTWKDIKSKLKAKEYAVELIRYRYFDTQFTDSVIYMALIISHDTRKSPKMVLLPNGNRMENQGLKYYRNCMKYGVEDDNSYQAFWQPIKENIDDNTTVYLSTEGVYNQINLETIPLPNDGGFAIDRNTFVLLSNTKDLLTAVKQNTNPVSNAYLFGNPVFYASTDSTGKAVEPPSKNAITPLPGTETEIQQIDKLLRTNRWIARSFTETQATEDAVKAIKSPRVFHVATHGFFLEDVNVAGQNSGSNFLNENQLSANPLLRSGLLFKDAGEILRGGNMSNYNLRNGILTAYEAMNLELDNTELVVLSACETGLGTVKIGEGVYGLQRAFLVAGAHNVVMSLFRVPDETTQKLMSLFYEKWIKTGDKRSAFIEAKKQLKKEYPQPIYWGSFVMMGQ
ncbi:Tetratricopeptide repeat-containing protein [Flexibacter flexilis DSM 6793]|uniref:Tetratricopeptide repeat-containing protein n=1 Tax=Flexibacter flexilis DSM 6793 TaxID=927664 RepID=A0A1I1DL16_9BACT|nr:CHAT domain-containing protein [Flexibacter flexilis]SFB75675.1 Tetratricopeptide repeat-containing protein [Flexibacter flexilis DSM 6793]